METADRPARPITGTHVLIALIVFFAVIIAVNTVFIVLATGSFTGEDVPKAYVQGVDYNRTLERRAAQKDLGWTATLTSERSDDGTVAVTLVMTAAQDEPLTGLVMEGRLRRPTQLKLDRPLDFRAVGPGLYRAEADDVEPGAWDVVIKAGESEPGQFEARRRIWLP